MYSRILIALIVISVVSPLPHAEGASNPWPVIQPKRQSFVIHDPDRAMIKTYIVNQTGAPLYLFVCRTGNDASVASIVYAGDLDCRLLPASEGEVEDNLLVEEHHQKAWFSRGRMEAYQLYGECGSYPEYGLVRQFRLRGMKLTIEFLDVAFAVAPSGLRIPGPPSRRLSSYTIRLTVESDRSAKRDIAESSGYLDPSRESQTPPRSCKTIQKGVEWTGK